MLRPDRRAAAVASLAALAGAGAVALVAELPGGGQGASAATATPVAPTPAQRAAVVTEIGQRLYGLEAHGDIGRAAVRRLARDVRLQRAAADGPGHALRANALRQLFNPGKHVVRLAVVAGGRPLVDVGAAFAVAPQAGPLPGTGGDEVLASMQDVVGYVKLLHRLTGAGVVVHGRGDRVEARPTAAARVPMPARSGEVTVAGRRYIARTVPQAGWAGEPLRVTVLVPVAA